MNPLTEHWRQRKNLAGRSNSKANNSPKTSTKQNQISELKDDTLSDSISPSFISALDKWEDEIAKANEKEDNVKLKQICQSVKRSTPTKNESIKRRKLETHSSTTSADNLHHHNAITVIQDSQEINFVNSKFDDLLHVRGDNNLCTRNMNGKDNDNSTNVMDEIDSRLLSSWGLPQCVLEKYEQMKIVSMFEWQVECLTLGNVLNGGNLIYSAPTSAGKTLVAEILVLKRVLELRKKAIIILPFVSVAREKMFYLQNLFKNAAVRVDGFIGNHHPPGGWKRVDVAVCTIEKANSLINRLLEENKLHKLGVVVVDELHMLGDPGRGYLLELLLTKIRYTSWKIAQEQCESENNTSIQIIGMSATLPNLDLLAQWLEADLYHTDFRPVPLSEHIKIGNKIFDSRGMLIRELPLVPELQGLDSDHVIQLCLETVTDGHSVLVFCPTKAWCETLAKSIARQFFNVGKDSDPQQHEGLTPTASRNRDRLRSVLDANALSDILEQLKRVPSGLDSELAKCIGFGTAFHHAGLTFDERDIIESAFRNNVVKVLVSTSTLSSGVNLPARRVIIRSPLFNGKLIDVLAYRQMVGRAGRKGIDSEGESILICKNTESARAKDLVTSKLRPIKSCLIQNNSLSSSMKRAVLEVIVSGIASTPEEVDQYCASTLLAAAFASQTEEVDNNDNKDGAEKSANAIKMCIKYLMDNEFIMLRIMCDEDGSEKKKYVPTPLGNAVMASSMSPDDGLVIFKELEKARRCFVLENELHVVYQVTPVHVSEQWTNMNWFDYLSIWQQLPTEQQRIGELVGVEERYLIRLSRMDGMQNSSRQHYRQVSIHQRFFTALALLDLVNEVPLCVVAQKYNCNRGTLQSLQQSASTFAGMVTAFCNRLGWVNLELLTAQFQSRLNFGIHRELCDLVRLPMINGQRARLLFDHGFCLIAELANADPKEIEMLLRNAGPFQSGKKRDGETSFELEERLKSRCMWLVGRQGVTMGEAAKFIVQEARSLLQKDLGVNIQWECNISSLESANRDDGGKVEIQEHSVELNLPQEEHSSQLSTVTSPAIIPPPFVNVDDISAPVSDLTDVNPKLREGDVSSDLLALNSQIRKIGIGTDSIQVPSHSIDENYLLHTTGDTSPLLFPPMATSTPCPPSRSETQSSFGDSSLDAYMANYVSPTTTLHPVDENASDAKTGCLRKARNNVRANEYAENEEDNLEPLKLSLSVDSTVATNAKVCAQNIEPTITTQRKRMQFTKLLNFSDSKYDTTSIPRKNEPEKTNCSVKDLFDDVKTPNSSTICSPYLPFKVSEKTMNILDAMVDLHPRKKSVSNISNVKPQETDIAKDERELSEQIQSEITENTNQSNHARKKKALLITPHTRKRSCLQFTERGRNIKLKSQPLSTVKKKLIREIDSDENDCQNISEYDSDSEIEEKIRRIERRNHARREESRVTDDSFTIIDVAAYTELYNTFIEEWKQQNRFSLSVACVKLASEKKTEVIGAKVKKLGDDKKLQKTMMNFSVEGTEFAVVGLAVSWEDRDAYYVSLSDKDESSGDCLVPPPVDPSLSIEARLEGVKCVLESKLSPALVVYDLKEQIRVLCSGTNIFPICRGEDPKVGVWLFDPTEREQTLHSLVLDYCPDDKSLLELIGGSFKASSIGLTCESSVSPRIRASVESVVTLRVMDKIKVQLSEQQLLKCFEDVEMPSMLILVKMELNGFGFSTEEFRKHLATIEGTLSKLEQKASQLAGRKFSLTSPADTAKVLYGDLGLSLSMADKGRRNSKRSTSWKRSKDCNTNKTTLHKLASLHPLPRLILEYRKLSSALNKIIFPFLKTKRFCSHLRMDRIFGSYRYYSATGRISMQDPNVQTVPRDMEILAADSSNCTVSLRNAFVPMKGGVLLSADYSQLELRILAHLSGDKGLLSVLNGGGDVFKNIAAQWKEKSIHEVTDVDRQQAKQICYGMVYGIGAKSLSEQLNVEEDDAATFMEDFKSKYTGMTAYILKVVEECREQGYVETLTGRRRYLPNITSDVPLNRNQAERQAVNTIIQGSAADLAKIAMIRIDSALNKLFQSHIPYRLQKMSSKTVPVGGTLVLQLHDELVYEVREEKLIDLARVVKAKMESAIKLSVKLPVKIQSGSSWGSFKELTDF